MMRGQEKELLEREVWRIPEMGVSDRAGVVEGAEGGDKGAAYEAHLHTGDGIFIPKGWWHSIRGVGEGVTASVGHLFLGLAPGRIYLPANLFTGWRGSGQLVVSITTDLRLSTMSKSLKSITRYFSGTRLSTFDLSYVVYMGDSMTYLFDLKDSSRGYKKLMSIGIEYAEARRERKEGNL
jgi:hypothetical protein